MTREEKHKRAEEKARRKVEIAEQEFQRKVQLAALKPYWQLLRYDINSRSCPRDFFLFWSRCFLWAVPVVITGLFGLLDYIRHLIFMAIIVVILCLIFPPVLLFVEVSLMCLTIGMIWLATAAMLFIALTLPIFLSAVKRRINDLSRNAGEAYLRFVLFVGTCALMVASLGLCGLSWADIPVFKTGCLSWSTGFGYVFLSVGLILFVGQMHQYSVAPGINGENFAGANPVEIPLTASSLQRQGSHLSSRLWCIISLSLVVLATVISFALSHSFLTWMKTSSPVLLKRESLDMEGVVPFFVYGMQWLAVAAAVAFVVLKSRLKDGDVSDSELASINACFKPKFSEVTDDLRNQVAQAEVEDKKRKGFLGIILAMVLAVFKIFVVMFYPMYYMTLIVDVWAVVHFNLVFAMLLPFLAGGIVVGCNYFKARVQDNSKAVNWEKILMDSVGQVVSFLRTVILLPFLKADSSVPILTRKRRMVRDASLIDPLGIRCFALGDREMGGLQVVCSILILGLPISWLWSVFDSVRFARMSDDEFLLAYPDFCRTNGWGSRFLATMSKASTLLTPLVVGFVLVALAIAFSSDGSDKRDDGSRYRIESMEEDAEPDSDEMSSWSAGNSSDTYKTAHKSDDESFDSAMNDLKGAFNDLGRQLNNVSERDFEKACEDFGREIEKGAKDIENSLNEACRELDSIF